MGFVANVLNISASFLQCHLARVQSRRCQMMTAQHLLPPQPQPRYLYPGVQSYFQESNHMIIPERVIRYPAPRVDTGCAA